MKGRTRQPDGRLGRGRTADGVILLGLLLAAASLRLPDVGAASLWLDECSSFETALRVARAAWVNVARALLKGLSAYFLVLSPWIGEETTEWAMRLPSVLAGTAFVPVAWLLGHQIGGRPLAWRLGLAVAASPFYVWHSREARWYSLTWLLAGLGAVFFVRALKAPSWRNLAGCLGFGLAAALTFSPAVTLVLIQFVWIGAEALARGSEGAPAPRASALRRLAQRAVLVILVSLGAAWFWIALLSPALHGGSRGFGFRNLGGPQVGAVLYVPVALGTGYTIGPGPAEWHADPARPPALHEALALLAGIGLTLVLLVFGWRAMAESGSRRLATALLSLGLVPPAAVVTASVWTDHRFAPRHVGMSFLYLFCLAAAGTTGSGARKRVAMMLGAALLLLQSVSLVNLHTSVRYQREDVRSAAGYVTQAAAPGDRVLVFGGIDGPWKHYYRGEAPWERVTARPSRGWSPQRIQERVREAADIFMVRGLILGQPGEEPLAKAVEEVTVTLEARSFHAIEVTRRRLVPDSQTGTGPATGP